MNFHLMKVSIRGRKNKDISVKTQRFAELARQAFQTLVEVEYEALGGAINNVAKSPFNQWVTGGLTLFHQTGMVRPRVAEVVLLVVS